jgi:hypothetical protein
VTDNIFPQNVAGYPSATREDPVVWFSGGQYHVLVDDYHDRKAMHLTSPDGITWKYKDLAYDPTTDMVRYTDGTVNHWFKLERVGVYMENGHVAYFTFAAIDVDKTLDLGNDKHGSKIIVVPFDGVKFDAETGIDGGTGGTTGTGGATALGGATATGGTTATGGATATGAVKTGGTVASGGVPASGGVVASGGTTALGGVIASGGAASAGVPGSGGVLATGGKVSSGGAFASGGAVASGGVTASASVPGSGGVAALGGATSSSAGTMTSTGVVIATGGTQVSTDGAGTGGSIQPSPATDGTAQPAASASGCSCRIDQSDNGNPGTTGLLIAACLFLLGRRRKRD